jgi:hypothetical protein
MSWEDYRERTHVLDAVLDDVTAGSDWRIPEQRQSEVDETFGGQAGFARALYPRWFAALSARLDTVLEEHPADLPEAAEREAAQLARERAGLFALLTAHADSPALSEAREQEAHYLDWAPGAQLTALAARRDELLPETGKGNTLSLITVIRGRIRRLPVLSGS